MGLGRPSILGVKLLFMLTSIISLILLIQALEDPKEIPCRKPIAWEKSLIQDTASSSAEILVAINNERSKVGLDPLIENASLVKAAEAKAHDMWCGGYWSHDTPTGKKFYSFIAEAGYTYSRAGENLAMDSTSVKGVVKAWMDSPTHKANIVKAEYEETGIAIEGNIVVQMFGTTS